MSNLLYRCALSEQVESQHEPREVLLRLYGPSHGDSRVQLEIFNQLASENLGPKLYGAFHEGRLEEYLPSDPLTWAEMTDDNISATIAAKLAAIHRLNVKCLDKQSNWLVDKYKELNNFIKTTSESSLKAGTRQTTRDIAIELIGTNFKPEIDFLDGLFQKSKSPLVFSHNDLHQNNIILLTDQSNDANLQNRVVLIDFEYCSYNYRLFDLANHLMEWCFDYNGAEYPHFNASYERFPSERHQKRFLAHYINNKTYSIDHANHCDIKNYSNGQIETTINGDSLINDDVELLYEEMQPFLMASNLLWAMWAIKSACTSEIAFGFWEMAKWKWNLYLFCKEQFLNNFMQ